MLQRLEKRHFKFSKIGMDRIRNVSRNRLQCFYSNQHTSFFQRLRLLGCSSPGLLITRGFFRFLSRRPLRHLICWTNTCLRWSVRMCTVHFNLTAHFCFYLRPPTTHRGEAPRFCCSVAWCFFPLVSYRAENLCLFLLFIARCAR